MQYIPVDRAPAFANHCSQLLRACADVTLTIEVLVEEVSLALLGVLEVVTAQFAAERERLEEVGVVLHHS